jgi:pantothenate kinase-related protein Tda10
MTQAEKSLLGVTENFTTIIKDQREKIQRLESLVRLVLNDLPTKRDWLDPQVEEALRTAVKANTPSSNHRALLDRWALNDVKHIQQLARKNGMT